MRKWMAALAVAVSLHAPLVAQAAEHFDLVYPKLSAKDDPRDKFPLAVLALAFKEEGATFTARKSDALMENSRAREAVAKGDGGVNITWTGLDVLDVVGGGPDDDSGEVEFAARFESGGRMGALHERSRFERRAGRWFYLDAAAEDV